MAFLAKTKKKLLVFAAFSSGPAYDKLIMILDVQQWIQIGRTEFTEFEEFFLMNERLAYGIHS